MNLYETTQLFAQTENDFVALWEKVTTLARLGAVTPVQRAALHKMRDNMFSQQLWLRGLVVRVIGSIPGAAAQIPMPAKFPDLPLPGAPATTLPVRGLRGGLGVAPVLVIAGVIIAIVAVIAGAYTLMHMHEVANSTVAEIIANRQTMVEAQRRFDQCRSQGSSAADCNAAVPIPVYQPRETNGSGIPGWAWALIGVGAAAVLFGGLYIWGSSSAPRIERGVYSLPERVR